MIKMLKNKLEEMEKWDMKNNKEEKQIYLLKINNI